MGLDMYLRAGKYVGGWDFADKAEKDQFAQILAALNLPRSVVASGSPSMIVNVTVGYWRKANSIHKWFVDNCQGGVDDCREAYVSREQLEALRDLAKEALERYNAGDKDGAGKILPPTSGFFFGMTEINEWYAEDMKDTVEQLDNILNNDQLGPVDFYYHSSW